MSVTFTRAPLVSVGDPLRSSDIAAQSDAINSRLRSGLAEPWRVMFLYASLFRQIRNPDNGLFPPDLEFFKFYQHLSQATPWPEAEAGMPAGINVTSSLASFIYGVEGPGVLSESQNLNAVPLAVPGSASMPATPREHWVLGKFQRGAVDISAGVSGAPMLDAGDQFFKLYQGPKSKHGNAFGGYLAGPEEDLECPDKSIPLIHFLTNTKTGAVTSFTSSCDAVGESGTNVAYIFETETSIFVIKISGAVQVFDRLTFMQGPYSGATKLRKTSAKMIDRVLAMFASEHRGTDDQRKASGGLLNNSFDFQKFFSSQYLLAPARGLSVGGSLVSDYPEFIGYFNGGLPAGHELKRGTSTGYPVTTGFVISSCLVEVKGFFDGPLQLEFLTNGVVKETAIIHCDANGLGSNVIQFRAPVIAGSVFGVRLVGAIQPHNSGSVTVEIAEVRDYKPRIFDAYAFLRLAGFRDGGGIDGGGSVETGAAQIFQRYVTNGNCTNATGLVAVPDALSAINQSGVFETARQLSKVVRIIPRQNLVSYEVANGKSILVFKRNVFGVGFADAFEGLLDVKHVAEKQGWTNEWLMGVEFKSATDLGNNTGIFRPEVYADHYSINNRCLFFSNELTVTNNKRLGWHVAGDGRDAQANIIAEAPSSFNFAKLDATGNINSLACTTLDCETKRKNFYKSCRIYEPWPEVDTVEALVVGGEERVKVAFKTRLRSTSGEVGGATDTISPDLSTASYSDADISAIKNEPFRTDENGIREYLFLQAKGINCCVTPAGTFIDQVGNRALNSTTPPAGTFGTCFPDFVFVKLIPTPYLDNNDTQEDHDSPVDFSREVQKEIYLRAICEGFVDGKATTDNCASNPGLYAFTYESLNFQAHGKAWPTLLTLAERPEGARGFWPIPNTIMRAEKFNQFSKAINLLDRVPLMLPFLLEKKTTSNTGSAEVSGIAWPNTSTVGCVSSNQTSRGLQSPVNPVTMAAGTPSAWVEFSGAQYIFSVLSLAKTCGTANETSWVNFQTNDKLEIRAKPSEPDQRFALPDAIRSMVDGFQTSFTAKITRNESYRLKSLVLTSAASEQCGAARFFDTVSNTGYRFLTAGNPVSEVFCETFLGGETFDCLTYTPPDGQPAYTPRGDSFFQGDGSGSGGTANCSDGWTANLRLDILGGNSDMFLQIPLV